MKEKKHKRNEGFSQAALFTVTIFSLLLLIGVPSAALFADEGASDAKPHTAHANTSLLQRVADHLDSSNDDGKAGLKPKIKPHLYADNSFNSNAAQTRKPNKAWQARVSPGVTIELPISDKLFSTHDYTYSFATTQGEKNTSHANTHVIDNLLRYEVSKDTVVGLRNNTQWNEVPDSPGNTYFLQTDQIEGNHRYGSRLSQDVVYTFQYYKDPNDPTATSTSDSFTDNGISSGVSYEATKDLRVTPRFGWNNRSFTKNNGKDYWQIWPSLNAEYALGTRTTLGARFGWAYRRFEDDGHADTLTYGAGISHLLSRKLIWNFDYDKTFSDTFDTSYVFRPNDSKSTNLDVMDRNFRVVTNHRIGTGLTYNLNDRNSLGAFGDFQYLSTRSNDNVISNTDNDEKKMEIGSRYVHRLTKYIAINLVYAFGRNFESHNNPAREQYVFHKVTAGVNIAL